MPKAQIADHPPWRPNTAGIYAISFAIANAAAGRQPCYDRRLPRTTGQVHGHIRLVQARAGDNLAHRKRTVPERLEYTEPRRVSQSAEQLRAKRHSC